MSQHQIHDSKPDINHVSKEELMQVPGIEEEMAEHIIQHRPYDRASDLYWLFQADDKRIEHLKEALSIPGEGPDGPAPTQWRQGPDGPKSGHTDYPISTPTQSRQA